MTFKDALHVLSTNLVQKMALPDWAKYLTKQTRKVDLAFTELKVCHPESSNRACIIYNSCLEQQYMIEMVEARRDGDKVEQRYDLFSGLLDAAWGEQDSEAAISDEELIGGYSTSGSFGILIKYLTHPPGNMFIFLLAGHEVRHLSSSCSVAPNSSLQTTAHTLCFSFALLALYPDEQERLYQHIKGIMSNLNGMPVGLRNLNSYRELTFQQTYEDMSRFTHSLA